MDDLNFKIDFENRKIKTDHGESKFILNRDSLPVEVKKGENIADLPKGKDFLIDYKTDGLEIPTGIYR